MLEATLSFAEAEAVQSLETITKEIAEIRARLSGVYDDLHDDYNRVTGFGEWLEEGAGLREKLDKIEGAIDLLSEASSSLASA